MTDSKNPLVRCYQSWISALRYAQPAILLALRVLIGVGFIQAGWGKLSNIASTTEYFEGLHIPMPELNAYMAGGTETVCGFLLLLGVASRIITVPLIGTMIVAYATQHANVFECVGHNPTAFIKAFVQAPPFPYLTVALVVLLFGPGLYSVDGILAWLFRGAKPVAPAAPGIPR